MSRYQEAIAAFRKAQELSPFSWGDGLLAHAYAVSGRPEEARRLLAALGDSRRAVKASPLAIATAHTGLGEPEEAFRWLELALLGQELRLVFLQVDPLYAPLRPDARCRSLVRKLGLPGS